MGPLDALAGDDERMTRVQWAGPIGNVWHRA